MFCRNLALEVGSLRLPRAGLRLVGAGAGGAGGEGGATKTGSGIALAHPWTWGDGGSLGEARGGI
jgi:hypothetical protein